MAAAAPPPPTTVVAAPTSVPPTAPAAPTTTLPPLTQPAEPTTLVIPTLGITAPVSPVHNDPDGVLNPPPDVHTVGWWDPGARPGGGGSTVIVGHVDSSAQGRGALYGLRTLTTGAAIQVVTASGVASYTVTGMQEITKGRLDPSLFSTAGPARLVLITCGGAFDSATGHYVDNIVAIAAPA